MKTNIIEKAKKLLQPIKYTPETWGYFVKQDDMDMGNEDYCRKCIPGAVKEAKKYHLQQRNAILSKYKEIEETGMFNGKQIKGVYSDEAIQLSKEKQLEEYSEKVKFTFEAHDPDFAGGQTEPLCCPSCGKYFETNFFPNIEEAKYILSEYTESNKISNPLKWKLEHIFYIYEHLEEDVREIFLSIAKKIVDKSTLK